MTMMSSIFTYLLFETPVFLMIFYYDHIQQLVSCFDLARKTPMFTFCCRQLSFLTPSSIPSTLVHTLILVLFYLTIFNIYNLFYLGHCLIVNRYKLLRDHLICSLGLSFGQCMLLLLLQDLTSINDSLPYWTLNIGLIVLSQFVFIFVASLTTIYYQTCREQSTDEFQIKLALKRKQKKFAKLLAILVNKRQIYAAQIERYQSILAAHCEHHGGNNQHQGDEQQHEQLKLEIERRLQYYRKYYRCIEVGIDAYQRKLNATEMQLAQLKNGGGGGGAAHPKKEKKMEDQRLEFY